MHTQAFSLSVEPISLNSSSISFTTWCSLLTLCFAPLLAHVVFGAPEPTILDSTRPRWHDRAFLYNPTSILWRYFAVVDRRLRSGRGCWTIHRAAASNALFWTSNGWDGSKHMITSSQIFTVHLSEKPRVKLLSRSSLKSLIITAQGVQALHVLVVNFFSADADQSYILAIDSLFAPLAAMGLIRLFAALWLLEDFKYSYDQAKCKRGTQIQDCSSSEVLSDLEYTNTWPSRIFRLFILVLVLLPSIMALFDLGSWRGYTSYRLTVSILLVNLYYMFWLTSTVFIFAFYFLRGHIDSTIIPCISSAWYKIYSAFLAVATLVLVVIVALETQQLPCGRFSTWPIATVNITSHCPGFTAVDPGANVTSVPFGIATVKPNGTSATDAREIKVLELTGFYFGQLGAPYIATIRL